MLYSKLTAIRSLADCFVLRFVQLPKELNGTLLCHLNLKKAFAPMMLSQVLICANIDLL